MVKLVCCTQALAGAEPVLYHAAMPRGSVSRREAVQNTRISRPCATSNKPSRALKTQQTHKAVLKPFWSKVDSPEPERQVGEPWLGLGIMGFSGLGV